MARKRKSRRTIPLIYLGPIVSVSVLAGLFLVEDDLGLSNQTILLVVGLGLIAFYLSILVRRYLNSIARQLRQEQKSPSAEVEETLPEGFGKIPSIPLEELKQQIADSERRKRSEPKSPFTPEPPDDDPAH
ncbi:MAG: hypothetical protein KA419_08170 [Acidobacteria bacterium]|nr:hypothetical protein [Acidobacteriota bacterium]